MVNDYGIANLRKRVDIFPFDLTKAINLDKIDLNKNISMNTWWPKPFKNAFYRRFDESSS